VALPDPPVAGSQLRYTVVYENLGTSVATGVVLTDVVPAWTRYVPGSLYLNGALQSDPVNPAQVRLVLGSVGVGASGALSFTVRITDTLPMVVRAVTNTAVITSTEPDLYPPDNQDTLITSVADQVDLLITKQATPGPLRQGEVITYTVLYTNAGPSLATPLWVTDTLPAEVLWGGLVEASPSFAAGPQVAGAQVTWRLASLFAGEGGRAVFTATVFVPGAETANLTMTNRVAIVATQRETDLTNNTATATTLVQFGHLGGVVWQDVNRTGIRDENSPVFGGVLITMTYGTLVFTTTSDSQGRYDFPNLPLNTTYTLTVSAIPGYNNSTPTVLVTTLTPQQPQQPREDFGFAPILLGDFIWLDRNRDGLQNDGPESALQGVSVRITYPTGEVYTTTTTATGFYSFGVPIGAVYTISLPALNFAPGGALYSYTPTLALVGSDPRVDSNGTYRAGEVVYVTPRMITDNLTFDFGLISPELPGDLWIAPACPQSCAGWSHTFSISYTHRAPYTETAASLAITLPANTLFMFDRSTAGLVALPGGASAAWALPTLRPGDTVYLQVVLHLFSSIPNGAVLFLPVTLYTSNNLPLGVTQAFEVRNDGDCRQVTPTAVPSATRTATPTGVSPTATRTPTLTVTRTPTATPNGVSPTATATAGSPTVTRTLTPTLTATPSPNGSATPTPHLAPTPTRGPGGGPIYLPQVYRQQ
jgi:uncharacterized repeat protein (TIGR01451 family)